MNNAGGNFKSMGSSSSPAKATYVPGTTTYKQAYEAQSDAKKATQSQAEFTTAAKAYNEKQAAKNSEVVGRRSNKPATKPKKQAGPTANDVKKQGLQTAAPGASGNVDKSHGDKTGTNKKGNTTTKKSNKDKSDTFVVSEGRTKGGSTTKVKDHATNREVDQTPSPDTSKASRSDRKEAKKGLDRQERKNYDDEQKAKKDMRNAEKKSSKVTGKQKRANKANEKDAANNKAMVAASEKKANTQKAADALEKKISSQASSMKNKGYYKK